MIFRRMNGFDLLSPAVSSSLFDCGKSRFTYRSRSCWSEPSPKIWPGSKVGATMFGQFMRHLPSYRATIRSKEKEDIYGGHEAASVHKASKTDMFVRFAAGWLGGTD